MACVGFLACKHSQRTAGSYFLLALTIVGILLGLRILLYVVTACLQRQQSHTTTREDDIEEIEMQARSIQAVQQFYQQQRWRRSVAPPRVPAASPPDEWQSKLVIAAGCDHVSFIAQPCPLQTRYNL
ncbi:hypothetical protein ZIOFF_046392 [Zingiber officinale]|uniref:Uncharacterized protein n=1 Tax=Zingiber officinale TaxID=94328 RepID=A0A8J5G8E6_ZINOF|nr:hypothetical protein ZIOFF_046392 [Zingiber officinale]